MHEFFESLRQPNASPVDLEILVAAPHAYITKSNRNGRQFFETYVAAILALPFEAIARRLGAVTIVIGTDADLDARGAVDLLMKLQKEARAHDFTLMSMVAPFRTSELVADWKRMRLALSQVGGAA